MTPHRGGIRFAVLAGGGVSLLVGLYAGLVRLGLPVPEPRPGPSGVHGPLMVFGFVGSLIALERAVALRTGWALLAPAGAAAGGVALLAGATLPGKVLLAGGGAMLIAVYTALWRRQPGAVLLAQAAGAAAWYATTLLWLGGFGVTETIPWMAAFVVLTIIGERQELAGVAQRPRAIEAMTLVSTGALLVGATASTLWPGPGHQVWGLALLGTVGWAANTDVARRLARGKGLPRYAALAVLAGYAWLGLASLLWAGAGASTAGPRYDAVVHAVFLGFTMSMIFAHAPMILPAVLRRPLPYHPVLYAPLALLHLSLLVRVAVGDLLGLDAVWQAAGIANEVAVLGFVGCAAALVVRARTRRPAAASTRRADRPVAGQPATGPASPGVNR
jgi:hypothetical protein